MRSLFVSFFLFAGFVACSHSDHMTVVGPDGAPWIAVTCSHGAQNCWREAGEVCPGGYVKADQGGSGGAVGIADRSGGVIVPTQHDQMLIQCKSGAAASR